LRKKYLLPVGFTIFIYIFSGLAIYMFTSTTIGGSMDPEKFWDVPRITNLEFIDGGSGNDTIVATASNRINPTLTITSGLVTQYSWLNNGIVYGSHELVAELFGDLTVPINGTQYIHLRVPKDALIAGKAYSVELVSDQHPKPVGFNYDTSQKYITLDSAPERYIFYHMYHPNSKSPVEEGIITDIAAGYYPYNYADHIEASIQNTGDFPITITGGFLNGLAAINTTDSSIHITGIEQCVIEKNATGSVDLTFPALSLYDQMQNHIPFNVKLVTAEGNIIEYPDTYFYAFDFPINSRIQLPTIVKEQAAITSVKFYDLGGNENAMAVTIHNLGSNPMNISSSLLNGKVATILSSNSIAEAGATQTLTLQASKLIQQSKCQVVLISKENNAFVYVSTFIAP
jgi:hypothetical protein